MNFPPMPKEFDDYDAALDAAGADMSPDDDMANSKPEGKRSLSMEEMLMEQFLDELIEAKQTSLAYQAQQQDTNTAQRQQADMVARKLGR